MTIVTIPLDVSAAPSTSKELLKKAYLDQSEARFCYLVKLKYEKFNESECENAEFVHYYSKPHRTNIYKKNVLLSSFNLKHLGTSRYKNFEALAEMMDQWDVVAAIELDGLTKNSLFFRRNLEQRKIGSLQIKNEKYDEALKRLNSIALPGYLKLLNTLNSKYPSSNWSFVISKKPATVGDNEELTGFYYKSHIINLTPSLTCPSQASACRMKFSAPIKNLEKYVSRPAFMARFANKNNDFTLFSSHFRYSAPSATKTKRAIKFINQIEDQLFDKFSVTSLATHRYIELYAHMKQIQIYKENQLFQKSSYILMGDLNISYNQSNHLEAWDEIFNATLKEATAYIDENTTLSFNGNFSNSYDHFIFNSIELSHCTTSSNLPKAFNFIYDNTKDTESTHNFALEMRALKNYSVTRLLKLFKNHHYWSRKKLFYNYTLNELSKKFSTTDHYLLKMVRGLKHRLIDSQFDIDQSFKFYIETISDHLPIEMTCEN